MRLAAHGLVVDVPRGWDARIFRRSESDVAGPNEPSIGVERVPQSGVVMPVLHLANFPLPDGRGDYGSGAVNTMRGSHVFLALVEFGADSVDTPLFAATGVPRFRAGEVSASVMQRPISGMGGAQRFFTVAGRAFCAYAVVGSLTRRAVLLPLLNDALSSVSVAPAT